MVWGWGVRTQRWGGDISSCFGPVLVPIVRAVSGQTGCDWLPKNHRTWMGRQWDSEEKKISQMEQTYPRSYRVDRWGIKRFSILKYPNFKSSAVSVAFHMFVWMFCVIMVNFVFWLSFVFQPPAVLECGGGGADLLPLKAVRHTWTQYTDHPPHINQPQTSLKCQIIPSCASELLHKIFWCFFLSCEPFCCFFQFQFPFLLPSRVHLILHVATPQAKQLLFSCYNAMNNLKNENVKWQQPGWHLRLAFKILQILYRQN